MRPTILGSPAARGSCLWLLLLSLATTALAQRPASPFTVQAAMEPRTASNAAVRFAFTVPADHVIYADRLKFETGEGEALPAQLEPEAKLAVDKFSGHEKRLFDQPFAARVLLPGPLPFALTVQFQGCSNSACYFPEKHYFTVTATGVTAQAQAPETPAEESKTPASSGDWKAELAQFRVAARDTGYMPKEDFLKFLARSAGGAPSEDALAKFKRLGLPATIGLIVLGGAGLNLTPCVLPMIPINLAIIGAGARASSRRRGFLLGGVYGAGMALVYGILGLAVVLTGSKFGALNASPWFNFGIAAVFVALALGMFDILNIDLSRFRGGAGGGAGQKSQVILSFVMGCMAALLAGACVAPVVISVLLLATNLFSQGSIVAGLLLPFLLGLGMALPWPFAGAGLTFLPKPGQWMVYVKYGFGALILLFALYYAHLGYGLVRQAKNSTALADAAGKSGAATSADALAAALQQARQAGRPVLVDFSASWCKNCLAMEETVFNQETVTTALKEFVVIKYQAEQPNEAPAREVLDRFGVLGLPTFVLLQPVKEGK